MGPVHCYQSPVHRPWSLGPGVGCDHDGGLQVEDDAQHLPPRVEPLLPLHHPQAVQEQRQEGGGGGGCEG